MCLTATDGGRCKTVAATQSVTAVGQIPGSLRPSIRRSNSRGEEGWSIAPGDKSANCAKFARIPGVTRKTPGRRAVGQSRSAEAPSLAGLHRLCSVELSVRPIAHDRRFREWDEFTRRQPAHRHAPSLAADHCVRLVRLPGRRPPLAWPVRGHPSGPIRTESDIAHRLVDLLHSLPAVRRGSSGNGDERSWQIRRLSDLGYY